MTPIETLRTLLEANNITREFTDETLNAILTQAQLLVDAPYSTESEYEDYIHQYDGSTYLTQYYPIIQDTVTVELNGANVTSLIEKVTNTGIIYFKRELYGNLTITYTVGLPEDDVMNYIVPIALEIIRDNEGANVASISEGDVSISYSKGTGENTSIDALINNLKSKYGARVRLL